MPPSSSAEAQRPLDLVTKVRETVNGSKTEAQLRERTVQALANAKDRAELVKLLLKDPSIKSTYDQKGLEKELDLQLLGLRQQAALDKKMEAEQDKPGVLRRSLNAIGRGAKAVLTSKWTWIAAAAGLAYLGYVYWPGIPAIQAWMARLAGVEAASAISGGVGAAPAAAAGAVPELLSPLAPVAGEVVGNPSTFGFLPPLGGSPALPPMPH